MNGGLPRAGRLFSIGVIASVKKVPARLIRLARLPAGRPGSTSLDQGLLVELGHVQCFEAGGQRPLPRPRADSRPLPGLLQIGCNAV